MIILMIILFTGLYAAQRQRSPQEMEALRMNRKLRMAPATSAQDAKRTLALTDYVEQEYLGDWVDSRKVLIEYDSHQKPLVLISQLWDSGAELWYDFEDATASYSPQGQPLQVTTRWWDGTAWLPQSRVEFTWEGNLLQSIQHLVDDGSEELLMSQELSYDPQTQRLEYLVSSIAVWDQWWTTRVSFVWDASGRASEISTAMLAEDEWVPYLKTQVSYRPEDQSNYQVYYDLLIKQLTFGDYDLYYLSDQILVNEEMEYAMNDAWEWELEGKYEYSYDASLNMLQSLYLAWDGESWDLNGQEDYSYDEHGNVLSWTAYDATWGELEPWMRRLNTYSEVTSNDDNVNPPVGANIRVFPNPFNPQTNIAFELAASSPVSLDIYNLKGQKVRNLISDVRNAGSHQIVFNGKDNSGRDLNSGIYFLRLSTNEGKSISKMILQK
jgi:hypothetical protein